MLPNNLGRYVQKPLHLQAKDRIIGHLNFAKDHEWRMADEIGQFRGATGYVRDAEQ